MIRTLITLGGRMMAAKNGCSEHALNDRVQKSEAESGKRAGLRSDFAQSLCVFCDD